MDRERTKELLTEIIAFAEGEVIQWQFNDESNKNTWRFVSDSEGINGRNDVIYRIKPEPEVIYVNKCRTGSISVYSSQVDANRMINKSEYSWVAKKFIEVLDDE